MFVQNVYHLLYKHTLSGGDAIAVLHTHDGMVWHHPVNKQSSILCILHWQYQFNKVDRIPISATNFRQIIVFL